MTSAYDNWKTTNPDDEYEQCPECGEGVIEGDRYEWACSEGCGYGGDNIPEPDDYDDYEYDDYRY